MMVDKAKMKRVMKQFTPKRATIAKVGSEPLELPNYSGVKKFVAERDQVFDHDQLSGVSASDHHSKTTSAEIDHDATINTHNLTTDISHDSIADVSADDHHAESHAHEGTAILSTGEAGGTKFLREDGDNTCSWQTAGAVPAGNDTEIQFNDSGSFGASSNLTYDGTDLTITGGQILMPTGTAANPAYSFASEPDVGMYLAGGSTFVLSSKGQAVAGFLSFANYEGLTIYPAGSETRGAIRESGSESGIYWPDDDKIAMTAQSGAVGWEYLRCDGIGREMIFNELSHDIDFRIESDADTHAFFIEGSSGNIGIGTATPTTLLDVNAKSGMSPIGGIMVKLTNTTGAVTIAGQLVRADTATNDAVIITDADNDECFGVFLDSGIADDAEAWVVVSGIADVAMEDNTTATRGNWVRTSVTEAGYADATNLTTPQPASFVHMTEIGHCIETVTATGEGTHVLARCILHFN